MTFTFNKHDYYTSNLFCNKRLKKAKACTIVTIHFARVLLTKLYVFESLSSILVFFSFAVVVAVM